MPSGTLEVFLVSASGLKKVDLFSKTDPYVVIHCGSQNQKSNVARNQGSNPSWNQRFLFYVDDDVQEITCKLMDEDIGTADDELGTVTIPLALVFEMGKTATTAYNVIRKSGRIKGEVKLALTFTSKVCHLQAAISYHSF
ncbi:hypothetical protein KP509_17G021100 [Ceratopteris richardii]|uniref:C2 domain-containing protein n=1 Tax=Ceratopteris richardii TaxID=49495 RepID=A0A8T2SUN7_CERRI|nr:hypothetical protein KP509_17G021100 [Ceratopteris richardii]